MLIAGLIAHISLILVLVSPHQALAPLSSLESLQETTLPTGSLSGSLERRDPILDVDDVEFGRVL